MSRLSLTAVKRLVKEAGDRDRARHDKAYHKTPLACWGVTSPRSKQLSRELKGPFLELSGAARRELLEGLWTSDVLDLRMLALALWQYMARDDLRASDWRQLRRWAGSATGWAELDTLASKCVGPLLLAFPRHYKALRKLSRHENSWLRRLSILCHLLPFRKGQGRWPQLRDTMRELMGEKEFFIRKAIGWILREISTRQPELTVEFVGAHAGELSGLSFREAVRRLPADQQEALKQARARATP